ncbi:hypothetical protein BDV95DRAFT_595962 [Massariosphaeria phaeospora]|uniref:Uncharacterized protein n=1 Tax=Massariosphaeria phaeospora TaxID=100035 RepID=A0A7C8M5Z3_9PLEO|nr:hypothetical protein BDV95DRAFT_595962 [Massariosphaeria phaeospora]
MSNGTPTQTYAQYARTCLLSSGSVRFGSSPCQPTEIGEIARPPTCTAHQSDLSCTSFVARSSFGSHALRDAGAAESTYRLENLRAPGCLLARERYAVVPHSGEAAVRDGDGSDRADVVVVLVNLSSSCGGLGLELSGIGADDINVDGVCDGHGHGNGCDSRGG